MKQPVPPIALKCDEAYFDRDECELRCSRMDEPCRTACWKCQKWI